MVEKKVVTGTEAFSYIRKQLDMGISLSHFVNSLPIEGGQVFSFVPEETSSEKLYDFISGGIHPFENEELKSTELDFLHNEAKRLVLEEIIKHIDENDQNCCIFENPNASPYFPWVKSSGIEYVHIGNEEMFFFFDKKGSDFEKVENAFTTSDVYIFLCALSSLDQTVHSSYDGFKEISVELLDVFVKNVSSLFVKAYDGEGYLMWVRN
jgi:hypothetical protein